MKTPVKGTLAWIPAVLMPMGTHLCQVLKPWPAYQSSTHRMSWPEHKQDAEKPLHSEMWGHALRDKMNQALSRASPATIKSFTLLQLVHRLWDGLVLCLFTTWASDPVTTQKIMRNYPLIVGDVVEWILVLKSSLKLKGKKYQVLPCTKTPNMYVSERLMEQLLQLSISINEMKLLCCICGGCGSRLSWCLMRARTESMK